MEYEFTIRQQIKQHSSAEAQANDSRIDADHPRNTVPADRVRHTEGGLESVPLTSGSCIDLSAGAVQEDFRDRYQEGNGEFHQQHMEWRDGVGGGISGEDAKRSRYIGTENGSNPAGEPRTPVTGWEDARRIFLRSASESQWTDWGNEGFAYENEEMDLDYAPRKRGADVRVEFGDLSADEVNSFSDGEDDSDDEDIDTEYSEEQIEYLLEAEQNDSAYAAYLLGRIFMCSEVVPKDFPEAIRHFEIASALGNSYADYRLGQIYLFEPDFFDMDAALEHLNRSAQAGNESAAMALQRMAENSFLSITTNVLELIGGLCDIEPRQPIKDCTTLPQKRSNRHWWEQRM